MNVETFQTVSALKEFVDSRDLVKMSIATENCYFFFDTKVLKDENGEEMYKSFGFLKSNSNPEVKICLSDDALKFFCRALDYPYKNLRVLDFGFVTADINYLMSLGHVLTLTRVKDSEEVTHVYKVLSSEKVRTTNRRFIISTSQFHNIGNLLKEIDFESILENRTMEKAQLTDHNFSILLRIPNPGSRYEVGELISYDWRDGPELTVSNTLLSGSSSSILEVIAGIQKRSILSDYSNTLDMHFHECSDKIVSELPSLISKWENEPLTMHTLEFFQRAIKRLDRVNVLPELSYFDRESESVKVQEGKTTWDAFKTALFLSVQTNIILKSRDMKSLELAGSYVNHYL